MRKLIVLNFIGLIVVIGLAAVLVSNARASKQAMSDVQGFTTVEVEAGEIRTQMVAMSDAMRGYLLNTANKVEVDNKQKADDALVASIERLLAATKDEQFSALATQIGELDETQLDKVEDGVMAKAATDAAAATKMYFAEYLPIRVKQMELVDRLQRLAQEGYVKEVGRVDASMDRTISLVFWIGGTLIVVMLGAFAWAAWTATSVTKQLARESETLAEAAGSVLRSAKNVSSASQSLSQGATEQAASLEETSASMEEMASMTRQNAQNSQRAAKLMGEVDSRVQGSNQALGDMITSMTSIQESSRQVAKIIKTIDEIAFQTNILALNAAVEAARAGEAGMGFAVVADEVRNLAQRSAQAARDTADMIDASIKRTEAGSEKVTQVAHSIAAITESVTQVKGLVDEVSVASQQQSQGIDQVSQAISQMEKVTQTTAATAEESAASSEDLNLQAERAMSVVARLEALVGTSKAKPAVPARRTEFPHGSAIPAAVEEDDELPATGTFGRF